MRCLTFKIRAVEHLKIGQATRQSDCEYAMDYIPGSALRGALIKRYLSKHPQIDLTKDEKSRNLFLRGDVRFHNSYLSICGQRSLPIPLSFYGDKDELKKWDKTIAFDQIINDIESDEVLEGYKKFRPAAFMAYDRQSKKAYFKPVQKVSAIHIAKDPKKNKIFRYEAIEKGQVFQGKIELELEDVEIIKELLESGPLYIGGSKGTGYGKCMIEDVNVVKEQNQIDPTEPVKDQGSFILFAVSDLLYLDQERKAKGQIDPEELKKALELEAVKYVKSSIETVIISGYNAKWGSRVPQFLGISAGSVFKYEYQGTLKQSKVDELVKLGIGSRKNEGYGQIQLFNSLPIESFELEKSNRQDRKTLPNLKYQEEVLLKGILQKLQKNKLHEAMEQYVVETFLEWQPKDHQVHHPLSNLLEVLMEMALMTPEEGINYFREYITHEKKKNTDTKMINQLKQIHLGSQRYLDYIQETIEEATNAKKVLNQFMGGIPLTLGGYQSVLTKEEAYQETLYYLITLNRYMLRKSAQKGRRL